MKIILGSIMLLGITLAGSTTAKIQCYEGTDPNKGFNLGFNSTGVINVTAEDKDACSVMTTVDKPDVVRAGASLEEIMDAAGHKAAAIRTKALGMDIFCTVVANKFCLGEGYSKCHAGGMEKTCYCLTNLCNNVSSQVTEEAMKPFNNVYCNKAPATTATLMPIIAMALAAKFGF